MILEYIYADNSRQKVDLELNIQTTKKWIHINKKNKFEFIKEFLPLYFSGQRIVLFDANHTQLLKFYQENDINNIALVDEVSVEHNLLFFTSGSSGFPIGAFKSKKNIEQEVLVLKKLVDKFQIKKVVVSVPFVHIYGVIAGLILPMYLDDVELIVKDDFLPYELLQESNNKYTLVITTPVFIKALSKTGDTRDLSTNLFICSTGPLHVDDISVFENKFNTNIMQIFGSTETGGIAYKFSSHEKWSGLDNVEISTCKDKLSINSPFVSQYILNEHIVELEKPFVTEDIVELAGNKFSLLGRGNKIIKIAGKRISALQIESILEEIDNVSKALVELVYKKELLRSEQILITLEASQKIEKKLIKKKILQYYGVLSIPFSVQYVDTIKYSAMGKKILF